MTKTDHAMVDATDQLQIEVVRALVRAGCRDLGGGTVEVPLGHRQQAVDLRVCEDWLRMDSAIVPWSSLKAHARPHGEPWRVLLEANRGLTGVALHREGDLVVARLDLVPPATIEEAVAMARRLAQVADGWQLRWS